MQEMLVDIIDNSSNSKILIVKNSNLEYFDLARNSIIHGDALFEISTIIFTRTMGNFKFCGNIFSWHGGSQFSGRWFDKYMHNIPIHVDGLPNNLS